MSKLNDDHLARVKKADQDDISMASQVHAFRVRQAIEGILGTDLAMEIHDEFDFRSHDGKQRRFVFHTICGPKQTVEEAGPYRPGQNPYDKTIDGTLSELCMNAKLGGRIDFQGGEKESQ